MPSRIEETDRPLSQLINTATRSVHMQLNQLVVSRLTIALPPHAQDASNYVSGLLHITPIYIVFESLWHNILNPAPDVDDSNTDDTGVAQPDSTDIEILPDLMHLAHTPTIDQRMRSVLSDLRLPGLIRSQELQKDIISLTGWSSLTVVEHLNDSAELPVLGEFLYHIKHAVEERPHVLLAYAWVLYMALFSGGRIIRATLEKVDSGFWIPASAAAATSHHHLLLRQHRPTSSMGNNPGSSSTATAATATGPLHFFSFAATEEDKNDDGNGKGNGGEDLKTAFKQRLAGSESRLTTKERDEIVREARSIFAYMVRLVEELDDICDTDPLAGRMLSLRSRDSVVVEKERRAALAVLAKRVAAEEGQESGSDA
ncbi:hypothetical protein SLS62_009854 [Diatrype stigma]|uniref:Uncharacterized protein n=1 Tax=Diatrype stigma TaxID=117547 RepID=A0AAN9UF21_9PEZI